MTRPVLILRPSPGAERTARSVAGLGLRPILSPLLRFERTGRLEPADLDGAQALAFTSAAAVDAAACDIRSGAAPVSAFALPAFCVGDATAARADAAGFGAVRSAAGAAAALRRTLGALDPAAGAVLHLQGADLAAALDAPGAPPIRTRVLYAARPVDALTDEAADALGAPAIALVHSRRIADGLAAALARRAPAALDVVAISVRAAAPLTAPPCREIAVARRPTEAALLDALAARSG